jgi:hypothetical protein
MIGAVLITRNHIFLELFIKFMQRFFKAVALSIKERIKDVKIELYKELD